MYVSALIRSQSEPQGFGFMGNILVRFQSERLQLEHCPLVSE